MTTTVKNIIIGTLTIGTIGYLYAKFKVMRLLDIWQTMDILPYEVRQVDISLQRIKFVIDVKLQNNSGYNFYVSGGYLADIKRMSFFYNGEFLANADVVINKIEVPAGGSTILKDIEVNAPLLNVLKNISALTAFDMNKITCTAVIKALGSEYTLAQ